MNIYHMRMYFCTVYTHMLICFSSSPLVESLYFWANGVKRTSSLPSDV